MKIIKAHKTTKDKVELYDAITKKMKELKKEADALKKEIMSDFLDVAGANPEEDTVYALPVDNYEVKLKFVATTRFDTTTFKKEHSDMYNQYVKSSYNKVLEVGQVQE